MALTYTAIATTTVGAGGASTIEFANIPGTYTDLAIKVSARGSNAGAVNTPIFIEFNSTGSGYTGRSVYGNGASTASDTNPYGTSKLFAGEETAGTATANTFGSADIYIPNYTSSNNKSVSSDSVTETNATTSYQVLAASLSTVTSAITNIKISTTAATNWVQYSTFTLYGIKNS